MKETGGSKSRFTARKGRTLAQPQILLDIDGVLNTFPQRPTHMWDEFQEHRVSDLDTGRTFTLIIGQPVIGFLNEIHAAGHADILWHTTWQNSANEVAKAFGITEFPVLPASEFDRWIRDKARGWWKLAAVKRAMLEAEAPVIWIDDDAGMYWVRKLYQECLAEGMSEAQWELLTVICPDAQSGLSQAHMSKIMKIIDIHEG